MRFVPCRAAPRCTAHACQWHVPARSEDSGKWSYETKIRVACILFFKLLLITICHDIFHRNCHFWNSRDQNINVRITLINDICVTNSYSYYNENYKKLQTERLICFILTFQFFSFPSVSLCQNTPLLARPYYTCEVQYECKIIISLVASNFIYR